jgi:hypothetical protein
VEFGTEYFSPDRQLSEHSIAILHGFQTKIILVGVLLLSFSLLSRYVLGHFVSLKNSLVEVCTLSTPRTARLIDQTGAFMQTVVSFAYRMVTNEKILWSLVGLIVLAINIPAIFLSPGFHAEGMDLNLPKNLARHGVYATLSTGGFDEFTYRISAGPGILLPQAMLFKLFGVNLYVARALQVGYIMATVIIFYLTVYRLFDDKKTALLSVVMFVPMALTDLSSGSDRYGPALLYFLVGTLFWWRAIELDKKSYLVASGLLWGLSFQAKWLYLFSVFAATLTCIIMRLFRRGLRSRYWIVPGSMVFLVTATWVGFRIYQMGLRGEYFHLVRFWQVHWHRAIGSKPFAGVLPEILSWRPVISLSQVDLWGELQLFLLIPALVYVVIDVIKAKARNYKSVFLVSFVSVWFLWWLLLSYDYHSIHIGPIRALGVIFIAKLFYDLWNYPFEAIGDSDSGKGLRGEGDNPRGLLSGVRVLVATVIVTMLVVGVGQAWRAVYVRNREFGQAFVGMIGYIWNNTEDDAVFSGWYWSLPWHVDLDSGRDHIIKDRSAYPPEQREEVPEYFVVSPEWPLRPEPSEWPNVAAWFQQWTQRQNAKRIAFLKQHASLVKEFPAGKHKWMLFKIKDKGVEKDK